MAAQDYSNGSHSYYATQFSLAWKQEKNTVRLFYKSDRSHLTTQTLPNTVWLLSYYLPAIVNHKCINDENLPFISEAANTEIAHLFEHILIECICREYSKLGDKSVVAKGVTRWHSTRFYEGEFYIDIEVSNLSETIFAIAMERATTIMEKVLASGSAEQPVNTVPLSLLEREQI